MRKLAIVGVVVAAGIVAAIGSAAIAGDDSRTRASANLSGFSEVPAVSSTGSGTFRTRVDRPGQAIHFTLRYSDLEGTTTEAAHIHLGQRRVNGGVIAFLCGGGGRPSCPARSAAIRGEIRPADIIGPAAQGIAPGEFDEVVRAIEAGVVYANVHTNKHPAGEIRGQLRPGG